MWPDADLVTETRGSKGGETGGIDGGDEVS